MKLKPGDKVKFINDKKLIKNKLEFGLGTEDPADWMLNFYEKNKSKILTVDDIRECSCCLYLKEVYYESPHDVPKDPFFYMVLFEKINQFISDKVFEI